MMLYVILPVGVAAAAWIFASVLTYQAFVEVGYGSLWNIPKRLLFLAFSFSGPAAWIICLFRPDLGYPHFAREDKETNE